MMSLCRCIILLTLLPLINGQTAPEVTLQDAIVVLGANATIDCSYTLSGTRNLLSSVWYNSTSTGNQGNLLVASTATNPNGRYGVDITQSTAQTGVATLIIANTVLTDDDYYLCTIVDDSGESDRSHAKLNVYYFYSDSMVFTATKKSVAVGNSTDFKCSVDAKPDPIITVLKDGQEVNRTTGTHLMHTISNVEKTDAGTYTCQVTNDAGSRSSEIYLEVQYKPEVTLNDQTIIPGLNLISATVLSNPDSYAYYWYTDLPGNVNTIKDEEQIVLTVLESEEDDNVHSVALTVTNKIGSTTASAKLHISNPCLDKLCENGGVCTALIEGSYCCCMDKDDSLNNCKKNTGLIIGIFFTGLFVGALGVIIAHVAYVKMKLIPNRKSTEMQMTGNKKQETYMEYVNDPGGPTYQDLQHSEKEESAYVNVKTSKNRKT